MYLPFAGMSKRTRHTHCVPSNGTGALQTALSSENETSPLYGFDRTMSHMKSTSVNEHGRLKSNTALMGLPMTLTTHDSLPPTRLLRSSRPKTGSGGGSFLSRRKRFSVGRISSLT